MVAVKGGVRCVAFGTLPESCSRHNCAARPHGVAKVVSECLASADEDWTVACLLEDEAHVGAVACAIGRALPLFSEKSQARNKPKRAAEVCFYVDPLERFVTKPSLDVRIEGVPLRLLSR
mmetsp:Transcript_4051/g.13312  ORF Transcript_4051/g.13312 Transcript_4051/m.13312 type:complete len:120 (-) Transcript_4051:272-631(-)